MEVTEKLRNALPEDDFLAGRMYNSCAVVGNSGLLLSFELGPEIDAHDMVMRFNLAPTNGEPEWRLFQRNSNSLT